MEHVVISMGSDEQIELPPGFRFHPTDEELITHYLSKKVLDGNFSAIAIGEVDLNKCEPWDLPWRAKMGEREWYFFCVRDRKYPTGLRTNRATEAGYWKATGKDKDIYRGKILVGMKKTLVFYGGRAPKGEKTDWVMHEYRLEGKYSIFNLPENAKNEWVICRVFKKSSSCAKKAEIGMMKIGKGSSCPYSEGFGVNVTSLLLPPSADVPAYKGGASYPAGVGAHVTCFSSVKGQEEYTKMKDMTESSNPLELNMNQQDYVNGSLMLLLQSNIGYGVVTEQEQNCCKKTEKDQMRSNISHETGITSSDVNPEISSVQHAQDWLWGY